MFVSLHFVRVFCNIIHHPSTFSYNVSVLVKSNTIKILNIIQKFFGSNLKVKKKIISAQFK